MPLLDVTIPADALTAESEAALLDRLMEVLLEHEGADPPNPAVREIAWAYLHRPAALRVGMRPADRAYYRVVVTVPEGILTARRRERLVAALTAAVCDVDRDAAPERVWVLIDTVPEGSWGAAGRVVGLADIAEVALGDRAAAERFAEQRRR